MHVRMQDLDTLVALSLSLSLITPTVVTLKHSFFEQKSQQK